MKPVFVVGQNIELTKKLIEWDVPVLGQVPEPRYFIPLASECKSGMILIDLGSLGDQFSPAQILGHLALLAPSSEVILIAGSSRAGLDQPEVRNSWIVFPEEAEHLRTRLQGAYPERGGTSMGLTARIDDRPTIRGRERGEIPVPQIISVFSPKGGVGKTCLAVNLAVVLARISSQPTVLVDLDLFAADVGAQLDFLGGPTLVDLIPELSGLGPEGVGRFLREQRESGLRVLVGPERPELADLVTREALVRILELLACKHRYIVLDHPSDPGSDLLYEFLERSHQIFLVTTLEATSLRQVRLSLQTLRRLRISIEDRVSIVANQVYSRSPLSIKEAEGLLEFPISASVPEDRRGIEESVFSAKPMGLALGGEMVSAISRIAGRVLPGFEPRDKPSQGLANLLKSMVWRLNN